ncbi:MAG: SDR family oxidoreductase [Chloroflexota bacterium]|nr:SDR family oxidoreductase [Chloroflexota bacterium]MDE2930861.1 SDR family oxidoreductase [Chloroflexota bacterium]
MDLELRGKTAIVSAGSKGLGKAIALGLAAEGARVAICSRNPDNLSQAAQEILTKTGSEVLAVPVDVTKPDAIANFVGTVVQRQGKIDILVNNAGGPPMGTFDDFEDKEWEDAFNLTFMSVIRFVREVLPHMRKTGSGRIINVTSTSVKQPLESLLLSSAIRPAVIGLAKSLANELAPDNILVNNICPGSIHTDRIKENVAAQVRSTGQSEESVMEEYAAKIPLGRLGEPVELADLAVFLASERASYITGATLQVDGGLIRYIM